MLQSLQSAALCSVCMQEKWRSFDDKHGRKRNKKLLLSKIKRPAGQLIQTNPHMSIFIFRIYFSSAEVISFIFSAACADNWENKK